MLYVMKSIQLNRTLYVSFLLAGCFLAALMLAFCLDAFFMLYAQSNYTIRVPR